MRDTVKGGALTEVTFCILLSLYTPKHGYAIMQDLAAQTEGRLELGAGTLYGALNHLQEKGWITPYGNAGGRKNEYVITAAGKAAAQNEYRRLQKLERLAAAVLEGNETCADENTGISADCSTRRKSG